MRTALFVGAVALAPLASAQVPVFFDSLGGDSLLQPVNDDRIEARFRADIRNWDTRLEFDSFPDNSDATGAVTNNLSVFEGTFAFSMDFDFDLSTVTWTIDGDGAADDSITQTVSGFDSLNTIQLFTAGSRGEVSLDSVAFNGFGLTVDSWPDLDTRPAASGGPTFRETFLSFGNGFDLLSGDWSLSGDVSFANFTHANPSEGAKITVKLRETVNVIPAPGSAALVAAAGVFAARRRR